MKELSIEEKAKAYDEALQFARNYYTNGDEDMKIMMKTCFPVLVEESEDVVIKEKIIATIHLYYGEPLEDEAKEMIAWLEKQDENNMGISEATKKKLEDNLNKALEKETPESWNEFLEKQGEQKPVEWHREDEQNLNACLGYIPDEFLRRWLIDIIHVKYHKPAWSEEDEKCIKDLLHYLEHYCILTSEREKCIIWLKSLKGRVQPQPKQVLDFLDKLRTPKDKVQPKQEWSGGDEAHLHSLITHLEQWIERHPNTTGADIQGENVAWLKSLKLKLKD